MSETVMIGISLAGLMIGLVAWLRADTRRMEEAGVSERQAEAEAEGTSKMRSAKPWTHRLRPRRI